MTFVVTQLAMGVTVLIARYLGEKKPEQIGAVLGGAAVVFALLSAGMFVLLVCFARPISALMQAPAEALRLTVRYMHRFAAAAFSSSSPTTCFPPFSEGWATANPR